MCNVRSGTFFGLAFHLPSVCPAGITDPENNTKRWRRQKIYLDEYFDRQERGRERLLIFRENRSSSRSLFPFLAILNEDNACNFHMTAKLCLTRTFHAKVHDYYRQCYANEKETFVLPFSHSEQNKDVLSCASSHVLNHGIAGKGKEVSCRFYFN